MAEVAAVKPRIAVVDDEKMLLHVFSSLLRQARYEADFFSSPIKAFDSIVTNAGRYQLALVDIKMPEMDGITFAKKIRFVLPNLPIIFMTGGVSDALHESALRLGNVSFLEKPFPLEQTLREIIPKFLGLKE